MPVVIANSLVSTSKSAKADYITIFDKDEVGVYDAQNAQVNATRGSILIGWRYPKENFWRIPLAPMVEDVDRDTVLVKEPPLEWLKNKPQSTEAVSNVFELRTQAEIVRYYHVSLGFSNKSGMAKGTKQATSPHG